MQQKKQHAESAKRPNPKSTKDRDPKVIADANMEHPGCDMSSCKDCWELKAAVKLCVECHLNPTYQCMYCNFKLCHEHGTVPWTIDENCFHKWIHLGGKWGV